jgi:hypothetical protein
MDKNVTHNVASCNSRKLRTSKKKKVQDERIIVIWEIAVISHFCEFASAFLQEKLMKNFVEWGLNTINKN